MKSRKKYYILYITIFILLFFFCFYIYLKIYNKSFFRYSDGFNQHYLSFLYIGRWGRTIVKNIFLNHKFSIPMWNQAIGYGADIPTTFAAYLWDPFNWISFFIPSKYAESGYAVMIVLKFFSCGVAYSILARSRNHSNYATLCGAIIYTFSAVLYVGFYQSFFINPLIIFPLLILGVDRLYEKNDSKLYVIMLAISFATYFYFAYMMCILVIFYFIIKLAFDKEKQYREKKWVLCLVVEFILLSLLAAGIAAISLIPSLLVMLQAGRLSVHHFLPILFHKYYYLGMLSGFTTGFNMLGRDCNIGWGAITLVCVITLFTDLKRNRKIKFEFIIMTVGLLIPFVGHVMNGFNYTANRWVWAYDLLIAYIVTITVPQLKNLSWKQIAIVTFFVGMYFLLIYLWSGRTLSRPMQITAVVLCVIIITCMLLRKFPEKFYRFAICGISCICVICLSYFSFSKSLGNGYANNTDSGKAFEMAENSDGLPLLNNINTSDGTRFDTFGLPVVQNATWLYGVSGLNFYVSVYNNNIDEFHNSIGLNHQFNYMYKGLERRSELEALMGVNHYFVNDININKPVNYQNLETKRIVNGAPVYSFSPEKKASMFYLFDKTLSYEKYYKLSPLMRQRMLMQACIIKGGSDKVKTENKIQTKHINYNIQAINGVSISGKQLNVTQQGGQVELSFTPQTKKELYIYLKDIKYKAGEAETYSLNFQGYNNNQPISNLSSVHSGTTEYSHMYSGITNQLINLGTASEPINRIVITFNSPGIYKIKNIQILPRDVSSIQKNINHLNSNVSKIYFNENQFGCSLKVKRSKRLFTSVPYSTGWKAYDNGKRIKIDKTDVAFMSVNLTKGKHFIKFVYRTPGLYEGFVITIISILLFIMIIKRRRIIEIFTKKGNANNEC